MLAVSYLDRGPSLQLGEGGGVLFSSHVFAGVIICGAQVWRTQHCPGSILLLLISVWLHSN